MAIETLVPDARNANRGTKRGAIALAKSVSELGAGRSILVDREGRIIAGNKTAEQAAAAGIRNVMVVPTDGTFLVAVQRTDLDLEKDPRAKQLAVADNRAGELNLDWDPGNLAAIANDVNLDGFFNEKEMGSLLAGLGGGDTFPDEAPDVPKKARTKPGTLYKLGRHRLLCGDATKGEDLKRAMGNAQAHMVWTDPPYNVNVVGGDHSMPAEKRRVKGHLVIENDSMGDHEFRKFLRSAFEAMLDATRQGGAIYIAHADSEGENFRAAMRESGWLTKQCLIWVKHAMVMSRQDYHWQHEPILYGWKPGGAHNWYSDRKQTTVLNFDRPTRSTAHPTMKPVALVDYCIRNSSPKSGVVLDPFGGSGTTLMACEGNGRQARLLELDPKYCDVIVQRWQEQTGKKAEVLH